LFVRKTREDAQDNQVFGSSLSATWPAGFDERGIFRQMVQGECINAVHQKLGTGSVAGPGRESRAAVQRCMRHGPGAID
jgi:hypothetical protein